MKKIIYTITAFCVTAALYAQNANLVLSGSGVRVVNSGNVEIVLNNANLVNDASTASFVPGTGTVRFTGTTADASIEGSVSSNFYNLRVDKSGFEVDLLTDAAVSNQAELINGDFDLNDQTLDLSTSGSMVGEVYPNGRRFYCGDNQSGRVSVIRTVNSGSNTDIAGLGLDLNVTGAAPGATVIVRGHDRQTSTAFPGAGTSIGRYYDITPTVTSGYTYQFVFRYHEQELGTQTGPDEANFLFYRSPSYGANTGDWEQWGAPVVGSGTPGYPTVGWASHNSGTNIVGLSGINSFSRWTVSNSEVEPLPIELLSFMAACTDKGVVLNWKTASEINNQKFTIHRSANLQVWEEVLTVPGAGNSNQELSYVAVDERPLDDLTYYRLTQTDFDGTSETFEPISILCLGGNANNGQMLVYPNPANDVFTVSIYSPINEQGALLYFTDVNGKMILEKNITVSEGTNNFIFDKWLLNPGTYFIRLKSAIPGVRPLKLIIQ